MILAGLKLLLKRGVGLAAPLLLTKAKILGHDKIMTIAAARLLEWSRAGQSRGSASPREKRREVATGP